MGNRHISVFLDESDAELIFEWFSSLEDVAFLWHDGESAEEVRQADLCALANFEENRDMEARDKALRSHRWKAYPSLRPQGPETYCLWHIPSGPVKTEIVPEPDIMPAWGTEDPFAEFYRPVEDPFAGWESKAFSNASGPWVGEGFQYFFIELRFEDPIRPNLTWPSGISGGGCRYHGVSKEFDIFWQKIRRFVRRNSRKGPTHGERTPPERQFDYFAWAYAKVCGKSAEQT